MYIHLFCDCYCYISGQRSVSHLMFSLYQWFWCSLQVWLTTLWVHSDSVLYLKQGSMFNQFQNQYAFYVCQRSSAGEFFSFTVEPVSNILRLVLQCFLFWCPCVVTIYTNQSSTIWFCTSANLWSILMPHMCHLMLVLGPYRGYWKS